MHATLDPMLDPESVRPQRIRPLARREYDALVELGMFQNEKIELLRGALVTMSPHGVEHAGLTWWLTEQLTLRTQAKYEVRSQLPFAADDTSEPEPDIVVSRRRDRYAHPEPADVLLVIEVSVSSLRIDRRIKLEIYAEAGVPEYWIVDVNARAIDVHREPQGGRYTSVVRFATTGVLVPLLVEGVAFDMATFRWE